MTDEKKAEILQLYSTGHTREEICGITGVKPDTLKKSIHLGKIILSRCETREAEEAINQRKLFLDTIKIIAYRAETSMANIIKPMMSHPDEALKLLQQVYKTDANIHPDYQQKILTVELLTFACLFFSLQ